MGYRTRVGPSGRDQGVDVLAYPDALGFQSPRIKVQVKHRQNPAGGPDIRNLVGALNADERGLFVSTGGFSKDARTEAGKNSRITLVDADELVLLLTEHYDKLDPDYKAMVPCAKSGFRSRSRCDSEERPIPRLSERLSSLASARSKRLASACSR